MKKFTDDEVLISELMDIDKNRTMFYSTSPVGSRDNSVGIATKLRAGRPRSRGFDSQQGQYIFLFFILSRVSVTLDGVWIGNRIY
jgi:hypothetical protein